MKASIKKQMKNEEGAALIWALKFTKCLAPDGGKCEKMNRISC